MNFQRKDSQNTKSWTSHLQNALSSRVSKQLREARWLLFAALAAYFSLVLFTYNAADPSWSHAVDVDRVHNSGGHLGAWVSDLLLTLTGYSAWWVVGLLVQLIWKDYRNMSDPILLARHQVKQQLGIGFPLESVGGFLALLLGSAGMEALRLHSYAENLPSGAGGVIGNAVKSGAMGILGFGGATLLFIVIMAAGASLFFNFSWLSLSEKIGGWIEQRFLGAKRPKKVKKAPPSQQRSAPAVVPPAPPPILKADAEDEFDKFDTPPAARIEPVIQPIATNPAASSAPVEKLHPSITVASKQQSLFTNLRVASDAALPAFELLDAPTEAMVSIPTETLEYTSRLIEKKLSDFGVAVSVVDVQAGPVITRYEIEPALGVKGSQIVNLAKDLARSLSLVSVRVVETIPGKNYMGLELPNTRRQTVKLSEILGSDAYHQSSSHVTMALGKDIAGNPMVADLAKMPHLLVAGTTGSGKSVAINAMIISILYKATARDVRMILIDPKMLEMSVYEGIPHLLAPVVTDMRQAANALNWCVTEMDKRYKLMSHMGVRNLAGFNAKIKEAQARDEYLPNPFSLTPDQPEPLETMPMIVVVIDELADLMMVVGKKIEELIARLAQKARAAGIHLILATQRPSVDVITGLIKANIPTRIAFQVSSKVDSRTILDQMGAESLLGQGDMFYLPPGVGMLTRVHGAFVTDDEVHRVVEELKSLGGEPNYVEGILEGGSISSDNGDGAGSVTGFTDAESDPLYDQAVQVVLSNRRASISLVQRHLRIGYNRAARLLEQMERAGLVSPMQSNGNREILVASPAQPEDDNL